MSIKGLSQIDEIDELILVEIFCDKLMVCDKLA